MKFARHMTLALSISLLFCSATAFAASADPQDQQPQTVAEILQVQKDLRSKLDNPTGEYSRYSQEDITRMRRAQDNVFSMLNGVDSLDQLNENQKTRLSNSLDEIKAILVADRGDRLICYRERRTGTNLVEKRCETAAQREARAQEAAEEMRRMGPTMQTRTGG